MDTPSENTKRQFCALQNHLQLILQLTLTLQYTYLHNARHRYFGFLGHAVALSLPPVLLVWAVLAFTVSLVVYVMQGAGDAELLTRLSAWTTLGVVIILVVIIGAVLYTFSMVWKFRQRTNGLFRRVKNTWMECLYV